LKTKAAPQQINFYTALLLVFSSDVIFSRVVDLRHLFGDNTNRHDNNELKNKHLY